MQLQSTAAATFGDETKVGRDAKAAYEKKKKRHIHLYDIQVILYSTINLNFLRESAKVNGFYFVFSCSPFSNICWAIAVIFPTLSLPLHGSSIVPSIIDDDDVIILAVILAVASLCCT